MFTRPRLLAPYFIVGRVLTFSSFCVLFSSVAQEDPIELTGELYRYGYFGWSVSEIPDSNGNGLSDIAVGQLNGDRVNLFDGLTGGRFLEIEPPNENSHGFGHKVVGLPDVNADGFGDLAVSARWGDSTDGTPNPGIVHVLDGHSGTSLYDLSSPTPEEELSFGAALSGVPDLSGDGVGDILVGVPWEEHGYGSSIPGKVHVFNGVTGDFIYTVRSPQEEDEDRFGYSIHGVPDIDQDGWGDFLVSAAGETVAATLTNAGRVYFFSGLDGALLRTLISPNPEKGGFFGVAITHLANHAENGRIYIAVGASGEGPDDKGRIYLFDGDLSELEWTLPGSALNLVYFPDGFLGAILAGVPDVTGDGFDDILTTGGGGIPPGLVIDGRSGSLFYILRGGVTALAGLSDVNGDGLGEIVEGSGSSYASGDDSQYLSGRAFLYHSPYLPQPRLEINPSYCDFGEQDVQSGASTHLSIMLRNSGGSALQLGSYWVNYNDPTLVQDFVLLNDPSGASLVADETFEWNIAFQPTSLGEKTARIDLFSNDPLNPRSEIFLYGTSTQPTLRYLRPPQDLGHDRSFGISVSALSDKPTIGPPRLAVGARGGAAILEASTGNPLRLFEPPSGETRGEFGKVVSGVPDLNGDGVGDLAIGEPKADDILVGEEVGRAYIYDGSSGALLHTLESTNPQQRGLFGHSLYGCADLTGDGFGDLLVGAKWENNTHGATLGRAYLFDGNTGDLVFEFSSPNDLPSERHETYFGGFGLSLSTVLDTNGDDIDDVLIGAPTERLDDATPEAGLAYLYDGSSGDLLRTFESPSPSEYGHFGYSLAGIEDVDGDQRGEIVVGAVDEPPWFGFGRTYVFSGANGNPLTTLISPFTHNDGDFGFWVTGIPDVNFNGTTEVAVGATAEPDGYGYYLPYGEGRVHLFDPLTGDLIETLQSPNEGKGFGSTISALPDMNGDNRPEIAIGTVAEERAYVLLSHLVDARDLLYLIRNIETGVKGQEDLIVFALKWMHPVVGW